ncbi:MAG: hypothetical protein Q7S55_02850 [Nanoarchaeota archaeon]|nr:hypothetical protein [Nanoarchaeota archaeon]
MAKAQSTNGKKQLSQAQEFEILKLVLDKFLWLGFIVMGWGMYVSLTAESVLEGVWHMIAGAVLLLLFSVIIIKEYEIVKS